MTSHPPSDKLIALPVQLIKTTDGTVIRRGCVDIRIAGEGSTEAIKLIFGAAIGEGLTVEELCSLFDPQAENAVKNLIHELTIRRFLVSRLEAIDLTSSDESNVDVFYWHFNTSQHEIRRQLETVSFAILGVNHISATLVNSLLDAGVRTVRVIDHPLLRNPKFFAANGKLSSQSWPITIPPEESSDLTSQLSSFGCLIATSDTGDDALFRDLNKYCLEGNRYFLPVLLRDFTGHIGPLVIPKEAACYECYRSRQNSHVHNRNYRVPDSMGVQLSSVAGFHPSMTAILGHISALELTRFFGGALPKQPSSSVIEVDLMASQMTARKVLKVPRCSACSSLIRKSQISLRKDLAYERSIATT